MNTEMLAALPVVLVSLLLGATFAWLLMRQKLAASREQGRTEIAVEFAALQEKLNQQVRETEHAIEEAEELEATRDALQKQLETVREERAQLQVHAERIKPLEDDLAETRQALRGKSDDLLRLTNLDGQKFRQIEDLSARLKSTGEDMARLGTDKEVLSSHLSQALAAKAGADEQLARLPELSGELARTKEELSLLQAENTSHREKLGETGSQIIGQQQQLTEVREALVAAIAARDAALMESREQAVSLAELRTSIAAERAQATEKLALLNEAREQLGVQFQNLANQILEEKSQRFTQQNQTNLGTLLQPLQERIKEFQQQVAATYDKDSKERQGLKQEIERLAALNNRISEDAVNLTQALKGSNKSQGIWGEIILENVLESSGLRKGQEYVVQGTYSSESGQQQRPDVVINLPEERHMVVDSKMSLLAYERYCSVETEAERQAALKEHLASVRTHVKGLSEKCYQSLHGLKSLDFVLMFVPVEPAFMLAVTQDRALFSDAFGRNVLLVSPSTLLATLRTIANIWRQEYQNCNAQAIADQCAKLYDKFVGFVDDLEEVGQRLVQTQKAYDAAHGKLISGRGNLIGQVEKVKKLGVKPTKALPASLLPLDNEIDEELATT
jgi:DNA recombination protein RmuC